METIYERIDKIICHDKDGNVLYLSFPNSFYEDEKEIIIKTNIFNTDLIRGWRGNLTYITTPGIDLCNENIKYDETKDTFYDVILIKVKTTYQFNDCMEWEYIFLKR